jgi:antitoxin PrlF
MATVTSKGQITLPKAVREALGLRPGSQVEFEIEGHRVTLRRQIPQQAFDRWEGFLRGKIPPTDVLMEELRGERLPRGGERL